MKVSQRTRVFNRGSDPVLLRATRSIPLDFIPSHSIRLIRRCRRAKRRLTVTLQSARHRCAIHHSAGSRAVAGLIHAAQKSVSQVMFPDTPRKSAERREAQLTITEYFVKESERDTCRWRTAIQSAWQGQSGRSGSVQEMISTTIAKTSQ